MSIKQRKEEELEVAGKKLAFKINGYSTQFWVDSGSPISIFIIGDLKRTLGKQNVQLQPIDPKGDQFREYGNNPLKLMESSIGWTTRAAIYVIQGLPTINHRKRSDASTDASSSASGERRSQRPGATGCSKREE